MRVIEQARLWFREGKSDKVYEVDLVEVAANQHVVNFRYGRRSSPLRDGTKTATPVDLARARSIFGKLVAEKIAGGYQHAGDAPAPAPRAAARGGGDPAAIIARLERGHRGDDPIGPYVWRAADRDLTAAEPALLVLLDAPPPKDMLPHVWQHSVTSALVRCGTSASLARLTSLSSDARTKPAVRDVARLAIVRIDPARAGELARPLLTPALTAALDGAATKLAPAAEELLATDPGAARNAAVALYLLDTSLLDAAAAAAPARSPAAGAIRAAVLVMARVARLSNAEAAVVRALFRLAELRRDPELLVRLARRIDTHTGYRRPFALPTRLYFRRRVARVIRRLGRAASPDYVPMASAILLSVSDADGQPPRIVGHHTFDRFARFHALNDIVYGNSPRYERAHHRRSAWRCSDRYQPGGPPPAQREERFAAVWDRAPAVLWRLLVEATNLPTIGFAARALRDHRGYIDALSDEALAQPLATGHPLAQQLALDMVRSRPMTIALARAALTSDLTDAHAWVTSWVTGHASEALRDGELAALLITGKTAAIRDSAVGLLRGQALTDELARNIAARALAILFGLPETAGERAAGAVSVLLRALAAPLVQLGSDVLRDLIRHPLAALGELAGELMLRHAHRDRLPGDLLEALLQSPHASVRTLGGRLLALTPPEVAKDDVEALALFATSGNRELRDATRALIGEVARRYPEVGRALADRLIDALLAAQSEGAPAHIVALLRGELAGCLPSKPAPVILRLIGALSPHAREIGGLLLPQLAADDVGLDDIARLASHEILAIRRGAWQLARQSLARFQLAPVALAKLVDSGWPDTRDFAAALIRQIGDAGALSADAIIAICDSIRPEVQALGKQLLHEQFQPADAGRYLVRLAEHPSASIQLLVSGLLEPHLVDDLDYLIALSPYLVTVLSQVNRGKVAKQRVIELLRREAARSAEAAAIIAPILDRQSATAAISQKHPLIAAMVDVHARYPAIPLPITVAPPPAHPKSDEAP